MPKKTREESSQDTGSSNLYDRTQTFSKWAKDKKLESTAVGACMRLSINPEDKLTESSFNKSIKEYQEGPSGGNN